MYASGHNAYRTNAVETASPEQLTLMCYDGAIRFMRKGAQACTDGDWPTLNEAVGRAQAIINELNVTLNMEAGGEIALNLRDLYLFVNRHLSAATMRKDPAGINEAIGIISGLRESWAQAMNLEAAA